VICNPLHNLDSALSHRPAQNFTGHNAREPERFGPKLPFIQMAFNHSDVKSTQHRSRDIMLVARLTD